MTTTSATVASQLEISLQNCFKNLLFVSEQETLGKLLEQHFYEAW
jgi:hypothetical protein